MQEDLVALLNDAYQNAADRETAVTLHLFGIKYADAIKEFGSASKLVKASVIPNSYTTEIHKGIKLRRYVTLRANAPI